jgi:hypothetical protein
MSDRMASPISGPRLGSRRRSMVKVTVTQQDIENGIRGNCDNCPIALAISRAFNARAYAGISSFNLRSRYGDETRWESRWVRLPSEAKRWQEEFDLQGPEKSSPISFEVENPLE